MRKCRALQPLADRFWSKVVKGDGCWEWSGSKTKSGGYGQLSGGNPENDYAPVRANRVSWELHFGPVPDGFFVCHKCDNPACVRPDHLFLGTPADNSADARSKGRLRGKSMPGEANPSARLSREQVGQIVARRKTGGTLKRIADEFGVSISTIHLITSGKKWASVTGLGR